MTGTLIGLVLIMAATYGLRWAWHRFFSAPLDPKAEHERLRQDLIRSYRIMRWLTKHYFRR